MNIEVFGEQRIKTNVDPIQVLEQMISKIEPHGHYIANRSGKYVLVEVGSNHRPYVDCGVVSKEDYEYVKNLKSALKYLYKKNDEELKLKREFDKFKASKK